MTATSGAPRQIGRYLVDGVLGRGAMGTVYLATDPHIQRQVALKTINPELLRDSQQGSSAADAELPARFINEARAAGRLVHPHIVGVFDYGEADGVPFIALEYVRGETLAARLAKEALHGTRLPLVRTLAWFAQLLDALAYAHEAGVIHRDIKPANLLIAPRGECKIADFGIAQLDTGRLTQIGMMIGTPAYMSPEQYTGAPIDARSDLFSAGVVLYEMLTGKCPFAGSSAAVMQQVLNGMPPAPSSETPGLPTSLDAMVRKALAKEPKARYLSAQSWRAELIGLLDTLAAERDPDETVVAAPVNREALAPPIITATAHAVSADSVVWPPELLAQLEERLAHHVGPVASLLVRRAAAHATNPRMLAAQLARHLPDEATRHQFDTLLQRHTAGQGSASSRPVSESIQPAARVASTQARVPDAAHIEAAARQLATHIGPVARIVAQRAALGVDTATFHNRLADALPATVDRSAFLRALSERLADACGP
ncbi:serine/threonine protein kinase [Paraburkholderia graminis]|jgi:eukaryotic-like serine/threonine-protein kinase|uniref:serine/threonine-protein kinase n=1 Tax=Paraburkholderia graminis TaxID=60548 RepID=UPI000DEF42C8|nr:serine/threonine-protein kinase [Paraburkholderia graminis]AXF11406.1 serine/threonine protein kinase [Paraburkholderia graminis]